jgi:hypothetical protein
MRNAKDIKHKQKKAKEKAKEKANKKGSSGKQKSLFTSCY